MDYIKKGQEISKLVPTSIEKPDIQKSVENPSPITEPLPQTPKRPPKKT